MEPYISDNTTKSDSRDVIAIEAPTLATDAVLKPSAPVPDGLREVGGIDFDDYKGRDITILELLAGMRYMGFQASAVADATRIINDMVLLFQSRQVRC